MSRLRSQNVQLLFLGGALSFIVIFEGWGERSCGVSRAANSPWFCRVFLWKETNLVMIWWTNLKNSLILANFFPYCAEFNSKYLPDCWTKSPWLKNANVGSPGWVVCWKLFLRRKLFLDESRKMTVRYRPLVPKILLKTFLL